VNWRSAADINYELEALDHLAAKGESVSTAVRRLDGARITAIPAPEGKRFAVLFTFAPGRELKQDEADSAAFGRSCAAIHAAADDFACGHARFKLDAAHLLNEPLSYIRPHLVHRPEDREFVEAVADRLRHRMAALEHVPLDRGFCHGDFHGGNVHRQEDRLTHFDFDCCGNGFRAHDIPVYRWGQRLISTELEQKNWPPFLAAYRESRSLSEADLAAVDLFVPIRQIWFMGMHLHGGPRWGFGWLGEKYFDKHLKNLREMEEMAAKQGNIINDDLP